MTNEVKGGALKYVDTKGDEHIVNPGNDKPKRLEQIKATFWFDGKVWREIFPQSVYAREFKFFM